MKNLNQNPNNKNQNRKKSMATRIAALGLAASIAPIGAVSANASQSHENATSAVHYETVNDAIVAQDRLISRDIGAQVPVQFKNTIAYYHGPGKEHFYIENPLSATVSVGSNNKQVKLIGYIERKGSGAGPDVVMFEDSPHTTSSYHDNADPSSIHFENYVTFPAIGKEAYSLNTPINPETSSAYLDQAGNNSNIGDKFIAKK